jgi:polyhydroxyalkanoate synthase
VAKPPREDKSLAEQIADDAAQNTLALNPLVGVRTEDLMAAAGNLMKAMAGQPQLMAQQWMSFATEFGKIVTGQSDIQADPKDRRFADPAWKSSGLHKALMQSYMAWGKAVTETVQKTELPEKDAARARLVASIFVDTMAPSNNPLLNPTAVKTFVDTGGKSAVAGLKNFLDDMTKNGGLPSSVDTSKFKLGENVANTPGTVVFRNDLVELVHYTATTPKVHQRPVFIVPPQINKYYSVDLAPEKSMIRFLLANGFQPYCVSWRNPTPEHADWGLEDYIAALDEACDAAREITGSDTVNIMGSCSGGITLATYVAWLAAQKKEKINAVIVAVCVLDTEADSDSDFSALVTPETIMAAKQVSKARGVLDGQEMAKMFAWMRPNDLIWNYWVNNYLLGNQPPAFDVLFWNADTTRLPAKLHGDFLDLIFTNPFVNGGKMSIKGVSIDMKKVKHDTYVIAGTTDHITPWKAVYQTARLFGDKTTFILSNSGHLQSLLNPPGNPKAWYVKGVAKEKDPEAWTAKAEKKEGSWWLDWAAFLKERSGEQIDAPKAPGSKKHKPLGSAPGTYVFEA